MNAVPTSCRSRLQARDFEFIAATLAGSPEERGFLSTLFEEPAALDAILENDRLFRAVMELTMPLAITPELYFYVLVRRSLADAGIDDADIADYVAATLADHAGGALTRSDRLPAEAAFSYHVDFVERIGEAGPFERFFLEVQCGNRFLVLTGLFPRFLERRAERRGAPGLSYYESVARQSFRTAGLHPLAEEYAVREIYGRLAECFHETRRALNRMAENRLFLGA